MECFLFTAPGESSSSLPDTIDGVYEELVDGVSSDHNDPNISGLIDEIQELRNTYHRKFDSVDRDKQSTILEAFRQAVADKDWNRLKERHILDQLKKDDPTPFKLSPLFF